MSNLPLSSPLSDSNECHGYLPRHVAVIMDGNGRWAQKKNMPRLWGHFRGLGAVTTTIKAAIEMGIEVLTLYAFSEENWGRPTREIQGIFSLLERYIIKEKDNLNDKNVRLKVIGNLEKIPVSAFKKVKQVEEQLSENSGLILNIALSYSGRNDILKACTELARSAVEGQLSVDDISPAVFEKFLSTKDLPDPDLLIRTSGERRVSNFLLWQLAYAELYFVDILWPDFNQAYFASAIENFSKRCRRFGLVSEKV
ncbi:MAG: hypothetical protein CMP11_02140 [Zetaproteobacteria bacterium]|nr:hypothetical protein [Pseudobdellovibrionaceae bacterium]